MTTVNLFTRPIFKEGALTANDPDVSPFSHSPRRSTPLTSARIGRQHLRTVGGREGTEAHAAKPVAEALDVWPKRSTP